MTQLTSDSRSSPRNRRARWSRRLLIVVALAAVGLVPFWVGGRSQPAQRIDVDRRPTAPDPKSEFPETTPARTTRFGVMTHFAQGWDDDLIPRIAEGRHLDVRDELYWEVVETRPGQFTFPQRYDEYMQRLASRGIRPFIVLSFENKLYDNGDTPHTPEGIRAFARYAQAVVSHYGDQIEAVEVWNEYNGSFSKGPATRDRAHYYTELLKATYAAVKAVRPDITVVGGATSGVPLPYIEGLLQKGALAHLDAFSVHPYRTTLPPEGIEKVITSLRTLLDRYSNERGAPAIWVSEIGWPLQEDVAVPADRIDADDQADYLVRSHALLAGAGAARVYWYLFRNTGEFPSMGLVQRARDYTPKPAFTAAQVLQRELAGAGDARLEVAGPDLYSVRFHRGDGTPVRVMWALTPLRVPATGATFAVDVRGEQRAVGETLTLSETPVFVTGPLATPPTTLAANAETITADAFLDFSATQGAGGWSYGIFVGDGATFLPLESFSVTEWAQRWVGEDPYLVITSNAQHPSRRAGQPVAAVRRWQADAAGDYELRGLFAARELGDGVRVRVLLDGHEHISRLIGGPNGPRNTRVQLQFRARPGTTVDIAVDPGPGTDINYDGTQIEAVIRPITSQS